MVNLVAADPDSLHVVDDFPNEIRIVQDLRIPMPDGTNLSARMWLPVDADATPVPAVVEYIPFRHRDFSAPRDAIIHPWFAGHGYASIRLEPRGSQESDGDPMDEYVAQEQRDAVDALDWISSQAWCTGATGMFGMSWGAFSALQVAALNPPSLKAIIPVHGTDDRFGEDIHFKGGCLLSANLSWSWVYTNYMMRPPDPALTGDRWREIWKRRIERAPFVFRDWVGRQSRDAYWRHGSVCEDYGAITAATCVFCGWADGYRNAALRMAEHMEAPTRVVIGPWAHTYPHIAKPGPQIGFLQEATRWWDRWLKDIDNGIDTEPKICVWMLDTAPPAPSYEQRGGHWIAEESWPSVNTTSQTFFLNDRTLSEFAGATVERDVCTPLSSGMTGGEWLPHGVGPEMPLDQGHEDVGALVFETKPLSGDLQILGTPRVKLKIRADQTRGLLNLRLSDVAPDGKATMICYGLLNLTGRNGFEGPEAMTPGEWMDVSVPLDAVAQRLPAGHRLRLSVGTNAFPLVWPVPVKTTCTLMLGEASTLTIPTRPLNVPNAVEPAFESAAIPPPPAVEWQRPVSRTRRIERDVVSGEVSRVYIKDDGAFVLKETGMALDVVATLKYSCVDDDPLSARAELGITIKNNRDDWSTELDGRLVMTSEPTSFHVKATVIAKEGDQQVAKRMFDERIARTFV